MTAYSAPVHALLLYDGSCGFCAQSVQFVLQHERPHGTLRFASLQSPTGVELCRRHPELAGVDSLIWVEPEAAGRAERVLVRSAAVLTVAAYLGGAWRVLGWAGRLVPRTLRDAAYRWIARNRHQLAADACLIPTPEQRQRFVDLDYVAPPA